MKEFCDVPFLEKREKNRGHLQNEGGCERTQKRSMFQKSANRSSWEMPRISNCPKLSRIIFIYVKFFINVFSLNCFYEAKNVSSSFHIREIDILLEETQQQQIWILDLKFYRVGPIEANTLGRKRWYLHTWAQFNHSESTTIFGILLAIFFWLSQHEVWTWGRFWRIPTSSLLRTEKSFPSGWSERSQIRTLPCAPHCPAIDSTRSG